MQCGSGRMHRSRRRNAAEKAIAFLGGRMRRCHECNSRFAQFGGSLIQLKDLYRGIKGLKTVLAMTLAAILVLAAILWLSRVQPAGSESGAGIFWQAPVHIAV